MTDIDAEHRLLGRDDEVRTVQDLLGGLPASGGTVVVEGDPGLGKTALLQAIVAHARWRGIDVLCTAGVQAEADVPLAALHQLIRALRDRVPKLPRPQQDAIQVAFGEIEGTPPNVFLLGLATLTLLSDRATDAGLLIVVDDWHWVDAATQKILTFVARRIAQEPVILLVAERPTTDRPAIVASEVGEPSVTRIVLGPLADEHAEAVLDRAEPSLPPVARRLVLQQSQGNPLALKELGATALPAAADRTIMPLTERLERAFAHRLAGLDALSRTVLLVAAITRDDGQPAVLAAASRITGGPVPPSAVSPLIAARLLTRRAGRLEFQHPLLRSVVVQTASDVERTHAHRAVAAALPPGSDRAVWHLAVVADAPDDELADAIADGAERLRELGDIAASVGALERAADLSTDTDVRARRLLRAAQLALLDLRLEASAQLATEAERSTTDRAVLAQLAWLRQLYPERAVGTDWTEALRAVDRLHTADGSDRALTALSTMAFHRWVDIPPGRTWSEMLSRVERFEAAADDPRRLLIEAFGHPCTHSASVRARIARIDPATVHDTEHAAMLTFAAMAAGSLTDVEPHLRSTIDALKEQGRMAVLGNVLIAASSDLVLRARFAEARAATGEALAYAREAGDPMLEMGARIAEAFVLAFSGVPTDVVALRNAVPRAAGALEFGPLRAAMLLARGTSEVATAEYAEAVETLAEVVEADGASHHWSFASRGFADFADATARSGQGARGAAVLRRFEAMGDYAESDRVSSALLFTRAVLAEQGTEENAFRAAIDPSRQLMPHLRARALLSFGEWLRRQHRVKESRTLLREARDELDALGMHTWADLARAELSAAGEKSPKPRPDAGQTLTPQEERVIALAASGLTNRQIAQSLFLSPRTVAAHLYSAYPKLGVAGRGELAGLEGLQLSS